MGAKKGGVAVLRWVVLVWTRGKKGVSSLAVVQHIGKKKNQRARGNPCPEKKYKKRYVGKKSGLLQPTKMLRQRRPHGNLKERKNSNCHKIKDKTLELH